VNKLIIQRIDRINPHWVALRFQGDDEAFRAMTELLGRQKRYNAYWDGTVLDGKGGWVARVAWIEQHKSRFANLDRMLIVQRQSS